MYVGDPIYKLHTVPSSIRFLNELVEKCFASRHYRSSPSSHGERSVSRRADHEDVKRYQDALAQTVMKLSSEHEFRGAFGGPVQTYEQLRLASHQEVFYLPSTAQARELFFGALNTELKVSFRFPTDRQVDPLMLVLKGFNQKVGARIEGVARLG